MAIVEEVKDEASSSARTPAKNADFTQVIRQLSAKLALPEDLLPTFLQQDKDKPVQDLAEYRENVRAVIKQMRPRVDEGEWDRLSLEDQSLVVMDISRLYGTDDWTSKEIKQDIDELLSSLPRPAIAHHILSHPLRQIFSPSAHPMLSVTSSRALSRPNGGPEAHSDFQDSSTQAFKLPQHWGCHNILRWCCTQLSSPEIEKYIHVILPPTLVLMDDWEPGWRGRGVGVLKSWVGKINEVMMKRMGMDRLLVDSLIHTLSLHANPPLNGVLEVTVDVVERTTEGAKRAARYAEVMEKGIVNGWMYAPSGLEGRIVLINIAEEVELLCAALGQGIVRWLKVIIPNLLDPLQHIPTSAVLPHFRANLSALLCVMTTCKTTGRIPRWRGQILDVLCRLWVQLGEQLGLDDVETSEAESIRDMIRRVVKEMERQSPNIASVSYWGPGLEDWVRLIQLVIV